MVSHGICRGVGVSLRKGKNFFFGQKMSCTRIKPVAVACFPPTNGFDVYGGLHREGERQGGERVELDALVAADLARHLGLELPVEQVVDDALVAGADVRKNHVKCIQR